MIRRRKGAIIAQVAEASVCLGPPRTDCLRVCGHGGRGRLVALCKGAVLVAVVAFFGGCEALGRTWGDRAGKGEVRLGAVGIAVAVAVACAVAVDMARLWIRVVLRCLFLGLGGCVALLLGRGAGRVGGGLEVRKSLHEACEGPLAHLAIFGQVCQSHDGVRVANTAHDMSSVKAKACGDNNKTMAVLGSRLVDVPLGLAAGSAVAIPLD